MDEKYPRIPGNWGTSKSNDFTISKKTKTAWPLYENTFLEIIFSIIKKSITNVVRYSFYHH